MPATNRSRRPLLLLLLVVLGLCLSSGWATTVSAAPLAQTAPSLTELVDEVERTGRYLEQATDRSITTAIDRANEQGIAVVWIVGNDTEATAKDVLSVLDGTRSSYRTVVVIGDSTYWAESTVYDAASAAELMVPDLAAGRVADAIDAFTAAVGGNPATSDSGSGASGSDGAGSGGGVPWIPVLLVAAAGFFAFRFFAGRRKAKRIERNLIEIDRAEIAEQLKNNADRVIVLGDQVIARKDAELIRIYEEASAAYQEVSTELEHASTVEQINLLDDKIDKAEWQFEVIEARIEGRTPPAAPAPDAPRRRPRGPATATNHDLPRPGSGCLRRPIGRRWDATIRCSVAPAGEGTAECPGAAAWVAWAAWGAWAGCSEGSSGECWVAGCFGPARVRLARARLGAAEAALAAVDLAVDPGVVAAASSRSRSGPPNCHTMRA